MLFPLFTRPTHLPSVPSPIGRRELSDRSGAPLAADATLEAMTTPGPDVLARASSETGGKFVFGPEERGHIFFSSPDEVADVLVNRPSVFIKGEEEIALAAAIGWGLLTEEGTTHRTARHAISGSMHHRAMENYLVGAMSTATDFVNQLAESRALPLVDWARHFSQVSAERLLIPHGFGDADAEFHRRVLSLNSIIATPSHSLSWESLSLKNVRQALADRDWLLSYTRDLILERTDSEDSSLWPALLEGENDFQSLHAQVTLFLQAATETTGSLIAWMLLALTNNPDHWTHLVEEAEAFQREGEGDYREMMSLPWHRAVVLEALRLYPPAWMMSRIAIQDTVVGSSAIPRGTRVWLSPWVSHRSNAVFSDAPNFRPERWMGESLRPVRGGYFPFGLGSRICVGERFSKMNATLMLLNLSRGDSVPVVQDSREEVATSAIVANPSRDLEVWLDSADKL